MASFKRKKRDRYIAVGAIMIALATGSLLNAERSDGKLRCWTVNGGDLLVPDGCTYVVDGDQCFNAVRVRGDGIIQIPAGANLCVNGSLSVNSTAKIEFIGTTGSPGTFTTNADLRMDGTFDVTGSIGGRIRSEAAGDVLTLSSTGRIEASGGPLQLSAAVEVDGVIAANGAHTITIDNYGPQSGSSGRLEVTDAGGKIKIDTTSAVSLTSTQIRITAGTFDCDESFTTGGGIKMTGGKIEVAVNKTFEATGPYAGP